MPMALECYGALSEELVHLIRLLSEKRANLANSNKSVVAQYWYKRISCTLQKGNSRAFSKKLLDIAQVNHACGNDECYDPIIDHEYANNDTGIVDAVYLIATINTIFIKTPVVVLIKPTFGSMYYTNRSNRSIAIVSACMYIYV